MMAAAMTTGGRGFRIDHAEILTAIRALPLVLICQRKSLGSDSRRAIAAVISVAAPPMKTSGAARLHQERSRANSRRNWLACHGPPCAPKGSMLFALPPMVGRPAAPCEGPIVAALASEASGHRGHSISALA